MQAALDILEADGPDAMTVQAVVALAGSSVGSFYARFRGKDDLLDYLAERIWTEALERWEGALAARDWSSFGLREIVEGAVGLLLDTERSRVRSLRALDRAPGRGGDGYATFERHLVSGLEALLLGRATEIAHPRPEVGVRVGLRAVLGVVSAQAEGALQLGREELVEESCDLLMRYLAAPPSTSAEGGGGEGVDFFHVWG